MDLVAELPPVAEDWTLEAGADVASGQLAGDAIADAGDAQRYRTITYRMRS